MKIPNFIRHVLLSLAIPCALSACARSGIVHSCRPPEPAWMSCLPYGGHLGYPVRAVARPSSLEPRRHAVKWRPQPQDISATSEAEYAQQVQQHLTAQLAAEPQDARAYFLRGNVYLDQRQFALARDDYTRALELMPEDPIAYNNRGIAHRGLGQPAQAVADYQ